MILQANILHALYDIIVIEIFEVNIDLNSLMYIVPAIRPTYGEFRFDYLEKCEKKSMNCFSIYKHSCYIIKHFSNMAPIVTSTRSLVIPTRIWYA